MSFLAGISFLNIITFHYNYIFTIQYNTAYPNTTQNNTTKYNATHYTEVERKNSDKKEEELTQYGYYKAVNMSKYSIPSTADVEELYGNKIIIEGLGQCSAYRKNVISKKRYIASAGLFNTGTNLLFKLLQRNCYIPERYNTSSFSSQNITDDLFDCETEKCNKRKSQFNKAIGMRDTVPWWKHGKVEWRDSSSSDHLNALPVVMIKDPVHWMSSMCRNPYTANFYRDSQCPVLDTTGNPLSRKYNLRLVNVSTPKYKGKRYSYMYDSLVDMWNTYYHEWMNVSFPNLIVRYEDLLFHPEEVITQVCTCSGGVMRDDFRALMTPAKKHGKGVMGKRNGIGRTDSNIAAIMYGTKEIRKSVLNRKDKQYTRDHLEQSIMHHFQYPQP